MAYSYTVTNIPTTLSTNIGTTNAVQINNPQHETILTINVDGTVQTKWGNTSIQETMEIAQAMKALIMEMAKDEETCKKFPIVEEVAHKWLMKVLKDE